MKKIVWAATTHADLLALPEEVVDDIGYILYLVQTHRRHSSLKVLRGFGGASVQEIKVNDSTGTYRTVYTIKFMDYVYVLHVFQRKSKSGSRTSPEDIQLIIKRLKWAEEDFKMRSDRDAKKG